MAVSTLHPESVPASRSISDITSDMSTPLVAVRLLLRHSADVVDQINPHPGRTKESIAAEESVFHFLRMAERELDDIEQATRSIYALSLAAERGEAA